MSHQKFIETLIAQQSLRENDLNKVAKIREQMQETGLPLLLVKLGLCSEKDVANALAKVTELAIVKPEEYPDTPVLPEQVSLRFLREYHLVGIKADEDKVVVAVMDPENAVVLQLLQLICDAEIELKIGVLSDIDKAIESQYDEGKSQMGQITDDLGANESLDDIEHLKDLASEAPVIRMVNLIFQRALESKASDIHFEPFEDSLIIRLRIDGVLQKIEGPPVSATAAVISRIKLMAKLNIAERRLPQDGRIKIQMQGKEIDLRVSTTPTMYGESVVIRLLDKENVVFNFASLGFEQANEDLFIEVLGKPHGIILITGPTGSGKSTTLYTALSQLNTPEKKIITVEDPVEYQLNGVNQIQAKPKIGLTFSSALRSIVRQDPDVIMIGEMRDLETAKIAVQSALTGHVVLSTLHTNDAAGALARLLDMGLDDYLLTSTVNGILAQRLVRKLCMHCREPYQPLAEVIQEKGLSRFLKNGELTLYQATGCKECGGIGYSGRLAIIEFLVMNDSLRKMVMEHKESGLIQEEAVRGGMLSIYQDGLAKAVKGLTTLDEVLRVATEE
ncbi:general secretion pathway protein E [Bathymodiolus platifrons methanotrophic gill symbiont]|uniref:type II secretion system ATPase GspE n=1 Tax=Bathymodiolus platifrons methanotrophic gill symbiont TaxID=113268 RepID=UPI000B40AAE8|nr:type II secretion system ATPase GspE [Bathymodiolus platifrons methanotrophic gill symbiont]MCK5869623.1 type II secretion system ATPase GspE [Methyloprofundus sp.]TXK94395.1 type II secretion system protein GspE [Methylococcaceae bacterium CS4]TXK94964.1 type II secretion system protein GspE [Methylococcaceae bacterium CS5]TXL03939.1 type II secretion system protein GspE [Methylococcaceae bacterium CS3]TXL07845.1 type II secretion system protein GspE [Methylococcaceae bacterium CS2]TXL082